MDTDGVRLIDIVRHRHQSRHGTKRHPLEVHIKTRHDDTHATCRQLVADIDNAHIEKLRLVDTHHLDIIRQKQDILAGIDRRGTNGVMVVADHILLRITHINGRLENLYLLLGKLRTLHTANQLLRLAGKHAAANHFYPPVTQ